MKSKTLTYSAANYYKKNYIESSVLILIFLVIACVFANRNGTIQKLVPFIIGFLLFIVLYGLFIKRVKKSFSVIKITEQGIQVKTPASEQVQIPWDDQISAGAYYAEMNVSTSGRTHYELILSSAPLPYSYKVDHIEQFSMESYQNTGAWRVSLGRGTKKWCEQEVAKITELRNNGLKSNN